MARKKADETYRSGDCSLGQREDGEALADYRNDQGTRKRIRLSVPYTAPGLKGKPSQAAKAALDDFATSLKAVMKAKQDLTVSQIWKMWLAEREADGYSNVIYNYNWVALEPRFGSQKPLLLVTQDYRDHAKRRLDTGISVNTVYTELARLRTCFKWASDHNHIPRRPKVWVPRKGAGRERVLSIDEARRLVKSALNHSDPHIHLFIVLAFATGARHVAILDLTWDRIDFDRGVIEYDDELPPDPMSKAWRKGRATVPMNEAARSALKMAHQGRTCEHVVEHGGRRLKGVGDGFRAAVQRAGLGLWVSHPEKPDEQAFVTDVMPHTIRHTVATWLDAAEVADKRRAQLLGHAQDITTNKTYTHPSHELLSAAVRVLDEAFAPLPKISHVAEESGVEIVAELEANVPTGHSEILPQETRRGENPL